MKIALFITFILLSGFLLVPVLLLALGAIAVVPFFTLGTVGFLYSKWQEMGRQVNGQSEQPVHVLQAQVISLSDWRDNRWAVEQEIRHLAG